MKKFTFTLLLLSTISLAVTAQKSGFGFKTGVTTNNIIYKDKNEDEKLDGRKTGISFGFLRHFQLNKHLALQPNLLASLRGGKIAKNTTSIWTIDLPVNLLYTYEGFFIGGGPNFSYALDGRIKGEGVLPDGESDIHSAEVGILRFKRVELGVNALMGYTFRNGISLSANFTQGLTDLAKIDENPYTVRSNQIGLSAAYIFGKKK